MLVLRVNFIGDQLADGVDLSMYFGLNSYYCCLRPEVACLNSTNSLVKSFVAPGRLSRLQPQME